MQDTELPSKTTQTNNLTLPFVDETPVLVQPEAPVSDWRSKVPTVSQLTRRLRGHIENSFFDVWVRGEISNFRKPVSGHGYFCLKDATSQLKAVMFKPALSKLKFQVKDGVEVLLHGNVTIYETRGEYQMVCDTMEPVGVGALQLAFEQLKQKLSGEGLFDVKYKKKLPFLPRRIGIVTSSTGAAVRDILKVLSRRFPNLHIILIPAAVQGEKAAGEIAASIRRAEKWNIEQPEMALDVLIVGRGGGSLEDLWPFNEEVVARSIFQCSIPIISAVGHEIDTTISDFVADIRAPTPSAAAEMVIPRKEELLVVIQHHHTRLAHFARKRLEQFRLHVSYLSQRLIDPRQKIRKMIESFRTAEERLVTTTKTNILMARNRLQGTAQMLNSLSPLQVIGRGYSLTKTSDGMIVRHIGQAPPGSIIETRVADGTIRAEVLSLIEQTL
jgi:exodeoxyribonuclease VII large subunit